MQTLMDFMLAHQTVLAGFVVAAIDLGFALNPSWKSNGILHSVYVFFQGILAKVTVV